MGKRIPRSSTMSNRRIDWRRCSRIKWCPRRWCEAPTLVKSLDSKPGEDHVYRPEVGENVMEYEKARQIWDSSLS
ncbi:hypothetical protein NL676_006506 [Syzygium grande]|nr:hypothetical protein NL676_006506 [Syzygium grande]